MIPNLTMNLFINHWLILERIMYTIMTTPSIAHRYEPQNKPYLQQKTGWEKGGVTQSQAVQME